MCGADHRGVSWQSHNPHDVPGVVFAREWIDDRATDVTINGGGFKHGATVTFGGVTAVTVLTSSTIAATAPIHSAERSTWS
jgi:hypothetical protein